MAEHKGLKNLYQEVMSGGFNWERWGLLSVLSDYVLTYTEGDILEIGCGESSIHFSRLAEKFNRKCYHVEFSKSGVENMKNTKGYFGKNSQVFNMKSDEFFSALRNADIGYPKLALVFIDGDHEYEQAKKDFFNTIKYVVNDGFMFLHDTLPPDESWRVPHRCGDVDRLRMELEAHAYIEELPEYDILSFPNSAFNVGLTMLRVRRHGL
jgi:hypothetical protein